MGLSGALLRAASTKCPHCGTTYGDVGGKKGHSKKNFIRCLWTADHDLSKAIVLIDGLLEDKTKLEERVKELEGQIGKKESD